MDYPGRIIAGIIALILIAVFPLQYIAQSNSESTDTLVDSRTRAFSEEIRCKGYLDADMYEDYMKFLDSTGELYDVAIEDIHPIAGKEHAYISGRLTCLSHYSAHKPADAKLLSKSGIASEEIRSFSAHTHTGDCYAGELHCCDGTDCVYDSSIVPEIVLHGQNWETTHDGYGHVYNHYCDYLYYSNNNGASWTKTRVDSANSSDYLINITYAPDGFFYTISDEDNGTPVTNVYKYVPSTGTITKVYRFSGNRNLKIWYRNNLFFFYNAPYIYYSTDCKTFNKGTIIGYSIWIRDIKYGNGVYVAVADETYYDEYRIAVFTSTDGINWTRTFTVTGSPGGFIFAKDRFVLTNDKSGYLYSSTNGTTWTGMKHPSYFDTFYPHLAAYGNNTIILAAYIFYVSTDFGQSWTKHSNAPGTTSGSISFFDGYFYITCAKSSNNTGLYKSTDGVTYTEINVPEAQVGTTFWNIAFNSVGDTGYIERGQCTKAGKYYDSNGNELSPICDRVVTSITATNPVQTVLQGDSIITTATAAYLDGHTGTVSCTSNFNPDQTGTQSVTLTYSGLVGNAKTAGTLTCTVSVTVKPAAVLSSLEATPSAGTVYNGTEPSYVVTAIYSDGSKKVITDGYFKTGWSSGPGTKTVEFIYTENNITVTDYVKITVLPNIVHINAVPDILEAERYRSLPHITVTGIYEDESSKILDTYIINDYDSSLLGTQTVTIAYTENNITLNTIVTVTVIPIHKICSRCGIRYPLDENDNDNGCPACRQTITRIEANPSEIILEKGMPLDIKVRAFYGDLYSEEVEGWTSDYDCNSLGLQIVTIVYGGYSAEVSVYVTSGKITCPICGLSYSEAEGSCPQCSEQVVSITADPDIVTVVQYETINLTVTAYYADGSSRIVDEWNIDRTAETVGTYEATVSYRGKAAAVILVVIPLSSIKCPICELIYEPAESPRGCPVCSNELTGIDVYFNNETNCVQIGTFPNIALILIYRDEHRELLNEGYEIENYDPYVSGSQIIAVRYKNFRKEVEVEVVNTLKRVTCPYGHTYYLNDDYSDPGCPYCTPGEGVSNVFFYDITYTHEILNAIYKDGAYYFEKGNFITITVMKKSRSINYYLKNTFFRTTMLGDKKRFVYGGGVY